MISAGLCALACGVFAQAGSGTAADTATPTRPNGRLAIEVNTGIVVLDFARINARDESFEATFYFELSWIDPSLADHGSDLAAGSETRRILDAKRFWAPRTYFENAVDQPKAHHEPVFECDAAGRVTQWAIMSGKFSARTDLRRFPFDRQVLPIRLVAFDPASDVRFVVNRELVTIEDDAFATDWDLGEPSAAVDEHRYSTSHHVYSRFTYDVPVVRRWVFYAWRVMLPLSLLTVVSFAAFWFEPTNLQPQISTCMAALIALVAFQFGADFSLPKVNYLTLIDKHAITSFVFVVAAVVTVAVVHRLVQHGRISGAVHVQRWARLVFPIAYATCVGAILAIT